MFKREFHVKKGSGAFMIKGLFYLLMMLLALLCCLFPKLYNIAAEYRTYIVAIGFSACLYFTFMFVFTVYTGIKPFDALILTDNGIYDFVNYPRKGIFIDWANVSSVKIFGSQKAPLLGIELYDTDALIETVKKSIGNDIRTNVEAGLPAIVIKQSEIAPRLSQILPAFNDIISATRPIPITNGFSDFDDSGDEPIMVVSDHIEKNTPETQAVFDEINTKTVRAAKKTMEEVFVLPNKNNTEKSAPLPAFPEFAMESEPIKQPDNKTVDEEAKTKEMPIVDLAKKIADSQKSPIILPNDSKKDPSDSKDNKEKNKEEIKSLDELLNSFSIPIGSKKENGETV
ncbi:MAG: hypothetical protein CVU97_00925 [Firmicutes bacterium HGW-Firmicutes-21]|nr:MAG: hypothetical protein CVU97_00925 [Firmicutes bacterium HGW-Firmicutes-21]